MTPHTITPALVVVRHCKAKAVRGTTPNGGVDGFIKGSTRNGHRDLKYPSPRRLRMVREDTDAPSKGATGA
ncbi:hypothetical protein TNCV_1743031 [Trichonephila clavipes]|nr:hypothetical protein TNCV_1743031 [Trichonephila clavipes]